MRENKGKKNISSIILLILFAIGVVFIITYNNVIKKPLKSTSDIVTIEVKKGEGFYDILNKLESENKLRNKTLIKLKLLMDKKSININEGIYEIKSDVTFDKFVESLENSDSNENLTKITIPEGYNIEEIGALLENNNICTKDQFIQAVKNYDVPSYVKRDNEIRYSLEGFLYPDTYNIPNGTDINNIIKLMLNRFESVMDEIKKETGINVKDEDLFKLITKAAMIEKESGVDKDRPLISSVIDNRLAKNMRLQLDATVLYALGKHVEVVYNKHLEVDSPYNTYKNVGLPIGPIGNPGKKSIVAALQPASTDYIYYILEKDGSHYFTKDYDDFLRKKKELGY